MRVWGTEEVKDSRRREGASIQLRCWRAGEGALRQAKKSKNEEAAWRGPSARSREPLPVRKEPGSQRWPTRQLVHPAPRKNHLRGVYAGKRSAIHRDDLDNAPTLMGGGEGEQCADGDRRQHAAVRASMKNNSFCAEASCRLPDGGSHKPWAALGSPKPLLKDGPGGAGVVNVPQCTLHAERCRPPRP
ncbi:hypothetical protein HPB50_024919 [Hyalomma asiaticum]|uniref:Uncharacterized protein n=1 Tax=Hyalomma asiaticum TaxID=266040 RepID=A0ACB7SQI2_HYAAI|nr:hypothetical protein HPB50_024919 [Hyalomma asiaticum]